MNKKLLKWSIIGFVFTFLLGTAFHFIFEFSHYTPFVAFIAPANECVFEHLKMVLYPTLIFSIIEYLYVKNDVNNYLLGKIVGIYAGIIFIIVFFYSYTAILGTHNLILDIISFAISIIIVVTISYYFSKSPALNPNLQIVAIIFLILLIVLFTIFTNNPPHYNLFFDPSSKTYGPVIK